MELNVFMDETSRTGQHKFFNGKWNYNAQPYFSLGALYISSTNVLSLYNDLSTEIEKEHFQGEFKWSNKAARKRIDRLFPVLLDIISRNNASIYFEIEDKRFTIAKTFTEYCVYPYYEIEVENCYSFVIRCLKRAFASYIADTLNDDTLWEICSFFDSGELDTTKLKSLIHNTIIELKSKYITQFCLETIDSIEQFENGKSYLKIENLFPVKDTIQHNGKCTTLTIDPHTDCFSDLLCRAINNFPKCKIIKCVHDEQSQWEPAFKESIERIKYMYPDYLIQFKSKQGYDIVINTVDYISGYLNFCISNLFGNNIPLPEHLNKLCESNLHLVSSITLQSKIWINSEIRFIKNFYDAICID